MVKMSDHDKWEEISNNLTKEHVYNNTDMGYLYNYPDDLSAELIEDNEKGKYVTYYDNLSNKCEEYCPSSFKTTPYDNSCSSTNESFSSYLMCASQNNICYGSEEYSLECPPIVNEEIKNNSFSDSWNYSADDFMGLFNKEDFDTPKCVVHAENQHVQSKEHIDTELAYANLELPSIDEMPSTSSS